MVPESRANSGMMLSAVPARDRSICGLCAMTSIVSLTVGFALDLALIPTHGATGAAAAASAAFLVGGATALFTYRRVSPFTWRALLVPHRGDLDVLAALAGPLLRMRPRREAA